MAHLQRKLPYPEDFLGLVKKNSIRPLQFFYCCNLFRNRKDWVACIPGMLYVRIRLHLQIVKEYVHCTVTCEGHPITNLRTSYEYKTLERDRTIDRMRQWRIFSLRYTRPFGTHIHNGTVNSKNSNIAGKPRRSNNYLAAMVLADHKKHNVNYD